MFYWAWAWAMAYGFVIGMATQVSNDQIINVFVLSGVFFCSAHDLQYYFVSYIESE